MLDVLLDAVLDSLKTLAHPFSGAFLLMEAVRKSNNGKHMDTILKKIQWGGPSGRVHSRLYPTVRVFSVHPASNLYAGEVLNHTRNPSFRLSLHLGRGHHSSAGRFQPGETIS